MKRIAAIPISTRLHYAPAAVLTAVLLLPDLRNFFIRAGWRWAYMFLLSLSLSFFLTPVFRCLAERLSIFDKPGERKLHTKATPLLGGAAVFFGFSTAVLVNGIFTPELWTILLGAAVLFCLGIWDDIREIPASVKLFAQLACTLFIMSSGIVLNVIPKSLGFMAVLGNIFLTVLWVIGITNAMNFFDGMNGLAAGMGVIISFFLGVAAFQTDQAFLGWIAVAIMGGCLGFLPFNFKKRNEATIFLGDAGSTVIGFVLACLAVYGEWSKDNPVEALAPPILIFWVLIFDMVHITVDRILNGKVVNLRQWVEYVGKDHLHHRLAYVLGSTRKSVFFIFLMNFCLGTSAIALRNARAIDAVLLIAQAAIIVVLITILERRGRRLSMECDDPDLL